MERNQLGPEGRSLLLGAVLCLLGCSSGAPTEDLRPDLVLITIDTLRADHVEPWKTLLAGPDGPAPVDTPAMDAFAAESIAFESAFSAVPITTASLGSMLTGRLPRHHGALNNADDLALDVPTMTMALADAGYETAAFLPSFLADKEGFRRGFETYAFPPLGEPFWMGEELVGRVMDFLDQREAAPEPRRPLFLWVHVLDPHAPYDPGPELEAKYLAGLELPAEIPARLRNEVFLKADAPTPEETEVIRALYRGDVEKTDRALAPLLARLSSTMPGEREIYTLLTADHGELLAEHEGYVGHTGWLYEETLRVPFLVHNSRGRDAGEVWGYPAFSPDVAPTLLALTGDPALAAEEARLLTTGDGSMSLLAPEVRALFEEARRGGQEQLLQGRLLVSETFAPEGFFDQRAARLGPLKWIVDSAPERPGGRFDLARDPREQLPWTTSQPPPESGVSFPALEALTHSWGRRHGAVGDAPRTEVRVDDATRDALEKLGYGGGR